MREERRRPGGKGKERGGRRERRGSEGRAGERRE